MFPSDVKIRFEEKDAEAQRQYLNIPLEKVKGGILLSGSPKLESEYSVPLTTKFAYLSVYFLCNVGLTIYNKAVLGKVYFAPFQFFLLLGIRKVIGLVVTVVMVMVM